MNPPSPILAGRLEQLFQQASDLDPAQRKQFLDAECRADDSLRRSVEALLGASEHAESNPAWNQSAIVNEAQSLSAEPDPSLDRYQLRERIGAGGMGVVYKAVRADDAYSKLVAVKIVHRDTRDDALLGRFRTERQILARLEHPNIARLLDGGTTADGMPFLVMEYVEGVPVDQYVQAKKLSVREILGLFRKICAAVSCAHSSLVVHRDLKPANILVNAAGEPKLLDFGIAKLLDNTSTRTITGVRAMTPEYASPEQLRAEPVNTATDIYSLGVLLYQLLSGKLPYRETSNPVELAHAICEEPPLSNAVVDSELQNILQMALRKEPARRYASVEQFSEDIRRYVQGYPILARPDTRSYRLRKFVGRNRVIVLAAALVALTLVGGIIATTREARIANQRFAEVRQLAHSVLFDYYDAVSGLPGSVAVRKRLVQDGVAHLDRLAGQAGNDTDLLLEMGMAYLKVGDVQARPLAANLGDVPGGLQSYAKSLAILEPLKRREPKREEVQEALAIVYSHLAALQLDSGEPRLAFETQQKSISISEQLCATGRYEDKLKIDASTVDRRYDLASSYLAMGRILGDPTGPSLGKPAEAERWYRKALALNETLPQSANVVQNIAVLHSTLGGLLTHAGNDKGALEEFRNALEADGKLSRMKKDDPFVRREVAVAHHNFAVGLLGARDFPAAMENFRSAAGILEPLAAADPNDANIRLTLASNTRRIAETYDHMGDYAKSADTYRQSIRMYEDLVAKNPKNASIQVRHGLAWLSLSLLHSETRDWPSTIDDAAHAARIFEPLGTGNPTARQYLARAYFQAGKGYAGAGNWREARTSYQRSVDIWQDVKKKGQLEGSNSARAVEADSALADSQKHLAEGTR